LENPAFNYGFFRPNPLARLERIRQKRSHGENCAELFGSREAENQIDSALVFARADFVNVHRMRGAVEPLTYHGTKKSLPVYGVQYFGSGRKERDVAALVAELQAIGDDPDNFLVFIKAVESRRY
jgi:hypothetical protein